MSELQFTSIDRVLSKFHRDLRGTMINETDLIEWTGEALDFLKVSQVQEQALAFIEIKEHQADLPQGFQMLLQVARNNEWAKEDKSKCTPDEILVCMLPEDENSGCSGCNNTIVSDINGFIIENGDIVDYRPYFDLKFDYQYLQQNNYYREKWTPVRLSNHTFFNSIVCKEKVENCHNCVDEYTLVGLTDKKIRTSFSDGYIAVSYLRAAVEEKTGYPLIPDDISFITAITYYIKWKISEWNQWNGRQGSDSLSQDSERKWLKYARQAKNSAKMPKSLDDFQNLLEQSHYLIPNHKKYYGYFGNLGRFTDINNNSFYNKM